MGDPFETKTITLSCGKITTGVTVKLRMGIFMLQTLNYLRHISGLLSVCNLHGKSKTGAGTKEIIKHKSYVFDCALDRALKRISAYSCQLNVNESNPEKSVAEFIDFRHVTAYNGSSMKQINIQYSKIDD